MVKKNIIENFLMGNVPLKNFDKTYAELARNHQDKLTKPNGSLGDLEDYAVWMAGWQKRKKPNMENFHCLVFILKNIAKYIILITQF